jgi:CDP-diacylglycerol--glycerol-3-phosphate 3-phosphatidyltransferase
MILSGHRDLFFLLLCVNLVTDIADGLIARAFKLETEFGAKLDSFADLGTYILAFTGMIVLEKAFIHEHIIAFMVLICFYVTQLLTAIIRFKKPPHLHLYSCKATGYFQGVFMLTYFIYGYTAWYFYLMITVSCLAYLEELVVLLFIPRIRSNVRGIYFMLKEHGRIA